MLFSQKIAVKFVKTLLVSTYAEVFLLLARIFALCVILFGASLINFNNQFKDLLASNYRNQRISELFFDYFYKLDPSEVTNINDYIFGWKDDFWNNLAFNTQFERIIGGVRVVQYRIEKPDDCLKTLSNFSAKFNSSQLVYSYSPLCNPNDLDSLDNLQPYSFDILNRSLCIMPFCGETIRKHIYDEGSGGFAHTDPQNLSWTPSFGSYPYYGFIADISFQNKTQFMSKLDKLLLNGWFQEHKTYALAFQLNTYNVASEIINAITIVIQLVDNHNPIPYMNIKAINTVPAYSTNWTTFAVLIIIADILFMLKIVFEGSIYPKSTQVPQFVNIVFELLFATICLIEQSTFAAIFKEEMQFPTSDCPNLVQFQLLYDDPQTFFSSITPCQQYIVLDGIIDMSQLRICFEGVALCFLPFNIFWLLTQTRLIQTLIKFTNMIYRTIYSTGRLLILFVVIILCWSAGFYKVFRHNYSGFNQYSKAIYSFIIWTIPSTNDPNWYLQASNTNIYSNSLQICLLSLCRMLLFIGLLTFTIASIYTASDFQFDFRSLKQRNKLFVLNEVQKKLEKFSKTYLQENSEGKHESNKLIAWLSQGLFKTDEIQALEADLEQKDIKLQQFGSVVEMIQFLQFLFQIKPQLLFKSSIHFRIMVDIKVSEGLQNDYEYQLHKLQEYQNVGRLLLMLKDKGSRVPILLNFSPSYRPSDSLLITFFKLYPFLYLNQMDFQELREFSFTQNFKQWKSMQIKEEPIQEDEEIEPSIENEQDL